jgi:hypothetical protein
MGDLYRLELENYDLKFLIMEDRERVVAAEQIEGSKRNHAIQDKLNAAMALYYRYILPMN